MFTKGKNYSRILFFISHCSGFHCDVGSGSAGQG